MVFVGFGHAVDCCLELAASGFRDRRAGAGRDIVGLVSIIDRDKFTM